MSVQIDQARQQHLSAGIDDVGIFRNAQPRADIRNLTVVDQHVDAFPLAVGPHATDQHAHATTSFSPAPVPTSTWNSTSIRTCTPLETCCSTADCEESATDDAISMPRSIGPGCSTRA